MRIGKFDVFHEENIGEKKIKVYEFISLMKIMAFLKYHQLKKYKK